MNLSKKKFKEICQVSVMDEVLREYLQDDYFANSAPEEWNDQEKLLYDIVATVEYQVLNKVKSILS